MSSGGSRHRKAQPEKHRHGQVLGEQQARVEGEWRDQRGRSGTGQRVVPAGRREGMRIEEDLFGVVNATEDVKEGLTAFLEKRKAEFKGR